MNFKSILNKINVFFIYSFLFLSAPGVFAGTGDFAGGANGSRNKIYESNISALVKLPIYSSRVNPLMAKFDILMNELNQNEGKNNFSHSQFLTKMKLWYFTEDTLNSLDKETLGIIFNEEKTQQLALNKKREIWIDNKIFSVMSEDHQVDLLIHEIVMNLYFLKYYSIYEVCVMGKEMGAYESEKEDENFLTCDQLKNTEYFQTKQAMVLTEDDYQNIRRVTNWFINELPNATANDLYNKLIYNGFDRRFITKPSSNSNKGFSLTGKEIESLLLKLNLADGFPSHCNSSLSKDILNCQISINKASSDYSEPFNKLEFSITDSNTTKKISFNISNKSSKFDFLIQSMDGIPCFTIALQSNLFPLALTDEVGSRLYILMLYFSPIKGSQTKNAELIGFGLTPFTITSLTPNAKGGIHTECEFSKLNPKKHPSYYWSRDDKTEMLIRFIGDSFYFSKSICSVRSADFLKKLSDNKNRFQNFLENLSKQVSSINGKDFLFEKEIVKAGSSKNNMSVLLEKNEKQKIEETKSCSAREEQQQRECFYIKHLKILSEDTALVNNTQKCDLNIINYVDLNFNENYRYHSAYGAKILISCPDNKLVPTSTITGHFLYQNGQLIVRDDILEYNKSFSQSETIFKEIP